MTDPPVALSAFADETLEREFQAEHFELSVRRFTRFSIGLSTVVFLGYALHDFYVVPSVHEQAWAIRFGVFFPVAAAVFAFTFTRAYARWHQPAMLAFGTAATLVVLWIAALSPLEAYTIYSGYAVLFVTLGPFLARMNVTTQVIYTLLSLAALLAFALGVAHPPGSVVVSIGATLVALGGIGALLARQLDAKARESFLQRRTIREERSRSEALLLNILPAPVAERLKTDGKTIADGFAEVTVLFADIVGFTHLSARLSPEELVERLNELFSAFDDLAGELGIEKIKTIGDAYMAVDGLQAASRNHAASMAEMALRMIERVREIAARRDEELAVRVGINTGPVVAGVIGKKKFIYDVWGDTVNTASRMESHGAPGRVQITDATRARLDGRYRCEERGVVEVKGKGPMQTWWLVGRRS